MNLKIRLTVMNFLEFAVWGAYLTCMGIYLGNIGMGTHIGTFYAVQGIVSIFMPAVMGIIADRWIQAQRLMGFCHLLAGLFMFGTAWYGYQAGHNANFTTLFLPYIGIDQFCGFLCTYPSRPRHRESLSSDTRFRNHRLHLHDVVR